VAGVALAAAATAGSANDSGVTPTAEEQLFVQAVNAVRGRHSLPPVRLEAALTRAARAHSTDMIRRRYFAHGDFRGRLSRFGARGWIGENLGWSIRDRAATKRVVSLWLASPEHRDVLLLPGFRRIGVGVAAGPFKGHSDTVVVTADFEGG
jgi:uncharacterized protein YkwD